MTSSSPTSHSQFSLSIRLLFLQAPCKSQVSFQTLLILLTKRCERSLIDRRAQPLSLPTLHQDRSRRAAKVVCLHSIHIHIAASTVDWTCVHPSCAFFSVLALSSPLVLLLPPPPQRARSHPSTTISISASEPSVQTGHSIRIAIVPSLLPQ